MTTISPETNNKLVASLTEVTKQNHFSAKNIAIYLGMLIIAATPSISFITLLQELFSNFLIDKVTFAQVAITILSGLFAVSCITMVYKSYVLLNPTYKTIPTVVTQISNSRNTLEFIAKYIKGYSVPSQNTIKHSLSTDSADFSTLSQCLTMLSVILSSVVLANTSQIVSIPTLFSITMLVVVIYEYSLYQGYLTKQKIVAELLKFYPVYNFKNDEDYNELFEIVAKFKLIKKSCKKIPIIAGSLAIVSCIILIQLVIFAIKPSPITEAKLGLTSLTQVGGCTALIDMEQTSNVVKQNQFKNDPLTFFKDLKNQPITITFLDKDISYHISKQNYLLSTTITPYDTGYGVRYIMNYSIKQDGSVPEQKAEFKNTLLNKCKVNSGSVILN